MTSVKGFLGGVFLLTLTACAGTYHSYIDNLKLAFNKAEDVSFSLEDVKKAPSDLVYVKHGERSVAAMALYKIEGGQHKWVSADNGMLIEEKGRIVRTLGFSNDLLVLTSEAVDPIQQLNNTPEQTEWLRFADWKKGEYGYPIRSTFEAQPDQQLVFFDKTLSATLVIEYVEYESPANYVRLDGSWQNRFWFESETGTLIKSEQLLAPFWQPLTMTYISRIARLLPSEPASTIVGEL